MMKLEIAKNNFQGVVEVLNASDEKLIKDLWTTYIVYLFETKQITEEQHRNWIKEYQK